MSLALFPYLGPRLAPNPRLYLHRLEEVDEPGERRGRPYWVLSRGWCRFFRIPPLAETSTARQLEALRLQIERLSPFGETGSHCDFGADGIGLWLWDAASVRDAAERIGIDLRRAPVLPETAMQPPGGGLRLVECLDGVEAQCWKDGGMTASRWWPAIPERRGWMLFQRGASVPPDRITLDPPVAVALPWLGARWTSSPADGWNGIANVDLRLVAACITALFFVGYAYLAAQWLRLAFDITAVERQIAAVSAEVGPITEARARTLDDAAAIRRLRELDPYPSQLALMAEVANAFPKNDTHLTEWSYDRGQLEITVTADQPLDAASFVRAFEQIGRFKNVSAERSAGDNSLHIRLTVEPQ